LAEVVGEWRLEGDGRELTLSPWKLIAKERHCPFDLLLVTQPEPWRWQLKLHPIPYDNERGSARIVVYGPWEVPDSWDGYGDDDDEQQPCAYQEFQQ